MEESPKLPKPKMCSWLNKSLRQWNLSVGWAVANKNRDSNYGRPIRWARIPFYTELSWDFWSEIRIKDINAVFEKKTPKKTHWTRQLISRMNDQEQKRKRQNGEQQISGNILPRPQHQNSQRTLVSTDCKAQHINNYTKQNLFANRFIN